MKHMILAGIAALAFGAVAFAQAPAGNFDAALAAAPAQMKDGAMVIKWKADGSYDTLRPGTNRLVCYDQSGDAGEQPVSSQCTSVGNLERVKQNKVYEAKIAEQQVLHQSRLQQVFEAEGRDALEAEWRADRERLVAERDRKIEKIRSGKES